MTAETEIYIQLCMLRRLLNPREPAVDIDMSDVPPTDELWLIKTQLDFIANLTGSLAERVHQLGVDRGIDMDSWKRLPRRPT